MLQRLLKYHCRVQLPCRMIEHVTKFSGPPRRIKALTAEDAEDAE